MNPVIASALKHTALHDNHVARGAKMTPFAGWDMPLQFSRVLEEHMTVRQAAGLFDVSHMGIVSIHGPSPQQALSFLDTLVPRDLVKRLKPGRAVYTQLLNEQGGILDDIILYAMPHLAERAQSSTGPEGFPEFTQYLMICNASNVEPVLKWFNTHGAKSQGIAVDLLSHRYSLIALQGPKFQDVLQQANQGTLPNIPQKRFALTATTIDGVPVLMARTGYTGEDGVEILVAHPQTVTLWDHLLSSGEPSGIVPVGLAARDTLRIEAGLPLHGQDITPQTTPLEAGLGWSVDLHKSVPFIGQSALQTQTTEGLPQQFICFQLSEKTIPRLGDPILLNSQPVGAVTSGTISPWFNHPIGMGYIKTASELPPNANLSIQGRRKEVPAMVASRPFYKPSSPSH